MTERSALVACFGDSDEDEAEPVLEKHSHVAGLTKLTAWLSTDEQARVLRELRACGWLSAAPERSQVMQFGFTHSPAFLQELSARTERAVQRHGLFASAPHFNQSIFNSYAPGEGICAHVDLAAFGDGIAVLSFLSPGVMTFLRGTEHHDVVLCPGDLLTLHGEARWEWTHGIAGESLRGPRCSITLRSMAQCLTELSHPA